MNLASQTNLAVLNVAVSLGQRTFKRNKYFLTFLAALSFVIWQSLQVYGSLNLVQSHSYALSNLHGIIIIPFMISRKIEVHKYERYGAAVVAVSLLAMLADRNSVREDQVIHPPGKLYVKFKSTIWTDVVMLATNVPGAIYFILNRSLQRHRIMNHIIIMSILTMLTFSLMALFFENAGMNLHASNGLFGWLNSENCFEVVFFYGFFCTFLGSVGYILSMQFFSPLVCMNAFLMEPIVAQVLGCLVGIDRIPNFLTILALLAITASAFYINIGTSIMVICKRRVFPEADGSVHSESEQK
mmetsp:Transcript_9622/g.16160  ORF Transcript_9622/g.16160 Transcript_9622/m.16160 type:complete len:299 (+) Transcript_9622:647-1543(+)